MYDPWKGVCVGMYVAGTLPKHVREHLPFEYPPHGSAVLQSVFSILQSHSAKLKISVCVTRREITT